VNDQIQIHNINGENSYSHNLLCEFEFFGLQFARKYKGKFYVSTRQFPYGMLLNKTI